MAKTAAQIYAENWAASIIDYYRQNGGTLLVDDSCGLHSVKIEQKGLQAYLEAAFTAGERAEFERLDRQAKAGDMRARAALQPQPLPEGVPCLSPLSGHQDGCACRECTD